MGFFATSKSSMLVVELLKQGGPMTKAQLRWGVYFLTINNTRTNYRFDGNTYNELVCSDFDSDVFYLEADTTVKTYADGKVELIDCDLETEFQEAVQPIIPLIMEHLLDYSAHVHFAYRWIKGTGKKATKSAIIDFCIEKGDDPLSLDQAYHYLASAGLLDEPNSQQPVVQSLA